MTPPSVFFKIPPSVPFLNCFAKGLWALLPEPQMLGRATVLLPYRRAALELRESLQKTSPQGAVLLPQIYCLDTLDPLLLDLSSLPEDQTPVHPLERLGILTDLILKHQQEDSEKRGVLPPPFITALKLAESLVGLLDQATIEEIDLHQLKGLVGEELAHHWQIILDFLKIILDIWPEKRKKMGWIEPYTLQNNHVERLLTQWEQEPPQDWVIVAGSTGTMPSTRRLIKAISRLPRSGVVLPGLTLLSQEDLQEATAPTHPQYNLARLLREAEVDPASIRCWGESTSPSPSPRERLLKEAFRPSPSLTSDLGPEVGAGLSLISCRDVHEESLVIALLLRQTLENPHLRATLVSPDPVLARLVKEKMKRWNINLGDSSGVPLQRSRLGILMLLVLEGFSEKGGSASRLLALLKHPWVGQGAPSFLKSGLIQAFEKQVLRGIRPSQGWGQLSDMIPEKAPKKNTLQKALKYLENCLSPLVDALQERHFFFSWVVLHRLCVERLMGGEIPERTREVQALETLLQELEEKGGAFGKRNFQEYTELFHHLLSQKTIVPEEEGHPRLQILGTLESRLIQTDVMILGGLNEGTWPTDEGGDPWLSRPMREEIGLPSLERRVGLMAHDFCQAFGGEKVFMTRSTRRQGTPTLPSRLLLRLQASLEASGQKLHEPSCWRQWAHQMETPRTFSPEYPPAPCPPLDARPRSLSVTQVELWRRDPYALYARHILKLKPLDPLDQEPSPALLGKIIHQACEAFISEGAKGGLEDLLEKGQRLFAPYQNRPGLLTFWWPRFCQIAAWFVEHEKKRRVENPLLKTLTEVRGKLVMTYGDEEFLLTARADRIDLLSGGEAEIIDYKTGHLPTDNEIERGFAPQLPLEGAILLAGGFDFIPRPCHLKKLSYWGLYGRHQDLEKSLKGDPETLSKKALSDFEGFLKVFHNPHFPYLSQPFASQAPLYSDYDHLARIQAWRDA